MEPIRPMAPLGALGALDARTLGSTALGVAEATEYRDASYEAHGVIEPIDLLGTWSPWAHLAHRTHGAHAPLTCLHPASRRAYNLR